MWSAFLMEIGCLTSEHLHLSALAVLLVVNRTVLLRIKCNDSEQ